MGRCRKKPTSFCTILALVFFMSIVPVTTCGEEQEAINVINCVPADKEAEVDVDTAITIVFDSSIQPGENWAGIVLNSGEEGTVVETVYEENTLRILPQLPLNAGTEYAVYIPAEAVKNLGEGYSFSFMTAFQEEEDSSAQAPEGYTPVPSLADKGEPIQRMPLALARSFSKAIPERSVAAIDTNRVLLVQTSLPWSSNANQQVLSGLNLDYTLIGIDRLASTDLTDYQMVIIANDQTQSFYNKYAEVKSQLEDHVRAGGVLVIGACDRGWASGNWTTTLPGGVQTEASYQSHNVVSNANHPIVTGILTDNQDLADTDLYSNYCSHESFVESSFPAGASVILREKDSGKPTLVEYPLGKGKVIVSGLTWEHNYVNHTGSDSYGTFARKSLDDLYMYAMANAGFSDYASAMFLSIAPNMITRGETMTLNFFVNPFEGKRDFYLYIFGEQLGRLWWNGSGWSSQMTSAGRFSYDGIASQEFAMEMDLPVGIYTMGAALIGQGTAMSPRPEYEASFSVSDFLDENTEIGTRIGIEYEQDSVMDNEAPCMESIRIVETGPYSRAQVLHLEATASDNDDDNLFFFWRASKGVLQGSSLDGFKSVQWTLPAYPGQYSVTGYVGDGSGKVDSKEIVVNID